MSNRVVPFDSKVDEDVSYKEQEMSSSIGSNEHSGTKSGGTLLSSMGSVGSFFSSEEEDSKVSTPQNSTGSRKSIQKRSSSKKARIKGRLNSVAKFGKNMMKNLKSLAHLRQKDMDEDKVLEENIKAAQEEIRT